MYGIEYIYMYLYLDIMNIIVDVSFLKQCRESWLKKYIVVVAIIIVGYKLVLTCIIEKKTILFVIIARI